ncbi:hypothetical protein K5F07_18595, partial [Acinetobacter baumannii]|nr:hypothetical protein [Acinetobacter baumannii]
HLPKLRLKFGSIRGALHFKSLCNKASLIPHFEDREESILWLTNFIGKICEPRKMQRQKKKLH